VKKITFDLDIYTYQIDMTGHVNNAVYINWMEIGRHKLLDKVGMPMSKLIEKGSLPTLNQTNITYKSPLALSDRVWIETWLTALGSTSVVIRFNFYNAGPNTSDRENSQKQVLVAEGFQRGLFLDLISHRPKRFTAAEKAALMPYLDVPSVNDIDLRPRNTRFRDALSRSNE
jgi:acyl-CoA thioester hydrolase